MSRIRQDCAKCNGTGWFYIEGQVTKCRCTRPRKKTEEPKIPILSIGKDALSACKESLPQIRIFLKQTIDSKNTMPANPRQVSLVQTAPLKLNRGILLVETKEQHIYNELKDTAINVLNLIRQKFKVKSIQIIPPKGVDLTLVAPDLGMHEQNIGEIAIGVFSTRRAEIQIDRPLKKGLVPSVSLIRWYSIPSEENPKLMREVKVAIKYNPSLGPFTSEDEDFLIALEAITQEQGVPEQVWFSPYELLKRTGRGDAKKDYERLDLFFHRAASNLIQYSPKGWYDAESGLWLPSGEKSVVFNMITAFRPIWDEERNRTGGPKADKCWMEWSPYFRRNFLAGWISWKLPLDIYFGLPFGLPRAIYRYIWKRLRGRPGEHREPLIEFFEGRMGLINADRGTAYMERILSLDRLKYWQDAKGRTKPTHLSGLIDSRTKQIVLVAENGFGEMED